MAESIEELDAGVDAKTLTADDCIVIVSWLAHLSEFKRAIKIAVEGPGAAKWMEPEDRMIGELVRRCCNTAAKLREAV